MKFSEMTKLDVYKLRGLVLGSLGVGLLYTHSPFLSVVSWVGLMFYLVAVAIRVMSRTYIGMHTRSMKLDPNAEHDLIVDGPYAYSRNPLYVSNIFMIVGILLIGSWPLYLSCIMFLICVGLYYNIIKQEEEYLAKKFIDYPSYKSSVPMWFRLKHTPKPNQSKVPNYKAYLSSFWSDRWTWFWQVLVFVIFYFKA